MGGGKAEAVVDGIYLVGGPNVSRSDDATVFVIAFPGEELVMIDAGAGRSVNILLRNIEAAGLDPTKISTIILTHCHIDHIGSAPGFRSRFGSRILIHELDAEAVANGDPIKTAANWYETEFPPTPIDLRISGEHETLIFGGEMLHCLHTPGHTPGSISVYLDREGKRILFGQDIHGPFMASFESDIAMWKKSMEKLLSLQADILCEGHFGIFPNKKAASDYIRSQLRQHT